jgi:hypothetical protein
MIHDAVLLEIGRKMQEEPASASLFFDLSRLAHRSHGKSSGQPV